MAYFNNYIPIFIIKHSGQGTKNPALMSAGRGQGSFGKTIDMLPSTFTPTLSRRDTNKSIGHEAAPGSVPPPLMSGGGVLGPQSAAAIYQHIHDMATKRISTLDYLRKVSVGHMFFFAGS